MKTKRRINKNRAQSKLRRMGILHLPALLSKEGKRLKHLVPRKSHYIGSQASSSFKKIAIWIYHLVKKSPKNRKTFLKKKVQIKLIFSVKNEKSI